MNIKVGSLIYVPSTEAQGEVTKLVVKVDGLEVWIKWENFPVSYPYDYESARHNWNVTTPGGCQHTPKLYRGITHAYTYCSKCNQKLPDGDS